MEGKLCRNVNCIDLIIFLSKLFSLLFSCIIGVHIMLVDIPNDFCISVFFSSMCSLTD